MAGKKCVYEYTKTALSSFVRFLIICLELHGNWKYIYNGTNNKNELYDLSKDPKELHNVADDYPEVVKSEFEMMAGWVQYQHNKMKKLLNN